MWKGGKTKPLVNGTIRISPSNYGSKQKYAHLLDRLQSFFKPKNFTQETKNEDVSTKNID